MNFSTYVQTFNFSAIDIPVVNEPFFVALGMCGESGEALEKVLLEDTPGLLLELGDTAWYICKMAAVLKLQLTPIHTDGKTLLVSVANLSVQSSAVADLVKKGLRGGELKVARVHEHLNMAIGLVAATARLAGVDLPTILQMNRTKLEDRQRRNVIHGSGDNR